MHHRFLLHDYRCADRRVVEKRFRHFLRNTNAAVRRGVGRHVALVHRVTAAEEHRVWHPRAIIMRALRSRILARIDIGLYDIAGVVHVIAEDSRNVRRVLRQDCIRAGRSAESRFAGRDR